MDEAIDDLPDFFLTDDDFGLILKALRYRSDNQTLTIGELDDIHKLSEKIKALLEPEDFLGRIAW